MAIIDPKKERRKAKRPSTDPYGHGSSHERVTAALGPKPRAWNWKQYHATAAAAPWAIDKHRAFAASHHGPAVLAGRRYLAPSRALTRSEKSALWTAHNLLRAGKITPAQYRESVAALDVGIVPSKRRRPKVGS